MIAEVGHYALILALGVAIVQTIVPLIGTRLRDPQLTSVAVPAAQAEFILIGFAFMALMTAYVTSDFSVANVWQNSHSAKPMLYKISGVWGNHEGSMLLWVLILALFGAAVATFGKNLPRQLQANVLAVQGSIAVAFLLFIITTSNPFIRIDPAPFDGQGLNPVLQDPALDGDQMRYSVDILDGDMPASGGANSLFIDMIGRPLTPVSVAGVHRRTRRRTRRRMR